MPNLDLTDEEAAVLARELIGCDFGMRYCAHLLNQNARRAPMKLFVLSLLAAFAVSAAAVQATQPGQSVLRNWKIMDACAKQAQTAYPEYNAESNAKRDAKLNECLGTYNLPPREPSATPGAR